MPERDYVILCDSNCDLSDETCADLGVRLIYMPYIIGEDDYSGAPDSRLPLDQFYNRMRAGESTKTYQRSPEDFRIAFTQILEEGKDILSLSFSAQLSNTYNNAHMMALELMEEHPGSKIITVDTRTATGGLALLLEMVCAKRRAGATLEETAAYAERLRDHIGVFFFVEDLEYLYRGGRLSKAGAVVGTIIGIKPILRVSPSGKLENIDKIRGRKHAIASIAKRTLELLDTSISPRVLLISAQADDDALALGRTILAAHPECNVDLFPLGCVIGAHTGPGTLGIAFAASSLE